MNDDHQKDHSNKHLIFKNDAEIQHRSNLCPYFVMLEVAAFASQALISLNAHFMLGDSASVLVNLTSS